MSSFIPFLLLLFFAAVSKAQGSISGTVLTASHTPVQGVLVYLYRAGSNAQSGHTFTDRFGVYTFNSLSEGNYKLKVSGTALDAFEYYNKQLTLATANVVTVLNETTTIIDVTLTPLSDPSFAAISGTIWDINNSGAFLHDIQVYAYALWPTSGSPTTSSSSWSFVYATKTDALGFWRILGINANVSYQWKILYHDPNNVYLSEWWRPTSVDNDDHRHSRSILTATPLTNFSSLPTTTVVDISLTRAIDAAVLSGTVTASATGLPLKGVSVRLYDRSFLDEVLASTITDDNGQYMIRYFDGSIYVVSFSLSEYKSMWWNTNSSSLLPGTITLSSSSSSSLPTIANIALTTIVCSNRKQDDSETDVDCGGSSCAACANGKHCVINTDCKSENCCNGLCQSLRCADSVVTLSCSHTTTTGRMSSASKWILGSSLNTTTA